MIKDLQHIYEMYESMKDENTNTIIGGLKFYKYNLVKDPNIPIEVFKYDDYKDRFSGATKKNLKKLQDFHKSPVVFNTVYKADISQGGNRLSFYIFGEIGDEPFVWARIEPKSFGAGSTKIYFKDTYDGGSKYLSLLTRRPTLTPQEDGTYRINDMNGVISYSTGYEEDRIGPEVVSYIPKGKYHRLIKPARIAYVHYDKDPSPTVTSCEFTEYGRDRFSVYTYPTQRNGALFFSTGGLWPPAVGTAFLSHEPIDLNIIAQEDLTK